MAGITFSGFNGFDFNQIIDATIQAESVPLQNLQKQQSTIQARNSALGSLNDLVTKLEDPVTTLGSDSIFSNVTATPSDATVVTASVGSGATTGQYAITVTQLAKAQVTASTNGYSTKDATAADGGSISFTIGSTTTQAISISSATSLTSLKDAINNQNSGVIASIVHDGTNYKLVISSRDTGSSNSFTINNSLTNSGGTAVAFAAGQSPTSGNSQNAQDAKLKLNGVDITSSSNTLTEAIPGISVQLVKEGSSTIDVTADFGALKETIQTLITQYNKLHDFANAQRKLDSITGQPMPLGNDTVIRQLMSDIRNVLLGSNSNGGRYHYLAEIGIELTQTGELKLDSTKYDAAVTSFASDVQQLFQGTTSNGVFDDLKTKLNNLDGSTGLIKTARDNIDRTLKGLRDQIAAQQLRLQLRQEELKKEYAAADEAMSKLNSMTSQLQGLGSRLF